MTASVMIPLFLPQGMDLSKLFRVFVAFALFTAAYLAEVVRGGLQAIPRGQFEGAMALGLGYWRMMGFVILPQALKRFYDDCPSLPAPRIRLYTWTEVAHSLKQVYQALT